MADSTAYTGLLVIGDPHLEGRTPGFRKDDYPHVVLEKLEWALRFAQAHRLLPAILGDLFDKPRDNPTWMLGQLLDVLADIECVSLYGNHDCADPELCEHDSFSLLVKAGRLRLLDGQPWRGFMNGRAVMVGGSSYRHEFPDRIGAPTENAGAPPLVFWLAHHDLIVPGYEEQGRIQPREIEGVDLVINGHIHRRLQDVQTGQTLWMTPGNISRRSRSDATKEHIPSVLRIDITDSGYTRKFIEVPHRPFDEVFHSILTEVPASAEASAFIAGLAELQARRTASGAGLIAFLEKNVNQFEQPVADQIMALAQEVTNNG
jgi:DNA repair exonuclease SbcCD nuclease subunit